MRSRERSKTSYLLPIEEQCVQQFAMAEKIGNDEVRPHTCQALALPLVDHLAFGLCSSDADRHAADLLHVLDLDIAVAEAEKLVAPALGFRDHLLDQDLLRKALVIIEGAENSAFEVTVNVEKPGLLAHVDLVCAARQVHL